MRRPAHALAALTLVACASSPPVAPSAPQAAAPVAPVAAPPVAAALAAPLPAASPPVDARTAWLIRLCKLWGTVRYRDPRVVAGEVDWDAALLAALPKALAATTEEDQVAAARVLLEALHDPATRVAPKTPPHPDAPVAVPSRDVEGVHIVRPSLRAWADIWSESTRIGKELSLAKLAVIDLRAPNSDMVYVTKMAVTEAVRHVVGHDAVGLAGQFVEYRGYPPQSGITSGGYESLLAKNLPKSYPATTKPHPARVVFVSNSAGGMPDVAWAMQRSGDAVILGQGPGLADGSARTTNVAVAGNYEADVRITDVVGAPPRPDVELAVNATDAEVEAAAVHAAKAPLPKRPIVRAAETKTVAAFRPDALYAEAPYPSRELRMLALFRFWNVIERFYPYLPLMGSAWDDALPEFMPRFEAAANVDEYAAAVAELSARIPDGHVRANGTDALARLRGFARPPMEVQLVEGRVVVTALFDPAAFASVGIGVGDVIESVDGEPVVQRMARLRKYIAASNESAMSLYLGTAALSGAVGTDAVLAIEGANGARREVKVPRKALTTAPQRGGPVYRLIDENIGYADLDRLELGDLDPMFAAFAKTTAIILDMRGYPRGVFEGLAQRLNVRQTKIGPQFFEPFVTVGVQTASFFQQEIPLGDKPPYRGKTVMLIDERTISQSEHTGLFLEAVNGTKFIGSQTAGANGDVTNLTLPGGIFVSFSGHDVRHADGRQLQRIGLVPDVPVRPTLAGLRAGRDEVLERATLFLRTGR